MDIGLIPFQYLLFALIPVGLVALIYVQWSLNVSEVTVAMLRMLVQLLGIGYLLAWIFAQQKLWLLVLVITVMCLVSTWISLRKLEHVSRSLYLKTLAVIVVSSLFTLVIVVLGVLSLDPVENLRVVIPLAGMIIATAMTAIGLASERFHSDRNNGLDYLQARNTAFSASLIPITNSMLAVGLVALPGMMTGQILSGVSPIIAVRYQIVVMCMVFGVAGLSSAGFLHWVARDIVLSAKNTMGVNKG